MEFTHSELHTHFMGMLSFSGLLELLYEIYKPSYPGFPINSKGDLDFKYPVTRLRRPTAKIHDQLAVTNGVSVPYSDLDLLYKNRNALLADLAQFVSGYPPKTPQYNKALKEIYTIYLNLALNELIEQGVEYVEISYANIGRIKHMLEHVDPYIRENIDFKFLLCTNRARAVDDLRNDINSIRSSLKSDSAVGFDFMGIELPFNRNEDDPDDEPSNSINSFKKKLSMVITLLHDFPKSTLRIHAGENYFSRGNPLATLQKIDEIARENGLQIPPPEIRLGHAIYFIDCQEYRDLLKKYKCIIEINATSNLALSNVDEPEEISYNYYLGHGIPVVISSDGGGVYDTTIQDEDIIARKIAGEGGYKKILKIDNAVVSKKGKK